MSTLCLHPKSVNGHLYPCGKCPNCRHNSRQGLANRLILHKAFSKGSAFFLTLTYNDENLPFCAEPFQHENLVYQPCFDKSHCINFFKRLRKAGLEFKYMLCCEYGETYQRPHYHCLMFLQDKWRIDKFEELIQSKWPYGFITIGTMTDKRVAYCLKYVLKEEAEFQARYHKYDYRTPFRLYSNGLGDNALDFINEYLYNTGDYRKNLHIGNISVFLDQHLKNKLDPGIRFELQLRGKMQEKEYTERLVRSRKNHTFVESCGGMVSYSKDLSFDQKILERRARIRQLKTFKNDLL